MSEKDNKLDGPRDDGRPKNFLEWISDRHVTVIIMGVLMIVIAERLINGLGNDCLAPAFRNMTKNWRNGENVTQHERCMWNKVFWHIIEFALCIFAIYLVSKYILKHRKRTALNNDKQLKPGHVRVHTDQPFPAAGVSSQYFYTLQP